MRSLFWMSSDHESAFVHLTHLCGSHGIKFTSLQDIPVGGELRPCLEKLIDAAAFILLPLSPEFVHDENCMLGLERAVARHFAAATLAVRVNVKPVWWPDLDKKLRHLPVILADGRPLSKDRWVSLAAELESLFKVWDLRQPRGGAQHVTRPQHSPQKSSEEPMSNPQIETSHPVHRSTALSEGQILGRRYKLVAKLGHDSLAGIWRAVDTSDGRLVTVHVLRGEIVGSSRMRVFGYMETIAGLHHPAIVQVVEPRGADGKHSFYVTETFEGTTVKRDALQRPMNIEEVISLVFHVGGALALAHEAGIAHGDVRPANLLTDGLSAPKLSDFQVLWDAESIKPLRPGAFEAHLYAAPELHEARAEPTPRSDVYSLCLTALFCLRGSELPDSASSLSPREEMASTLHQMIDDLDCFEPIKAVLKRAASPRLEERYEEAGAFRAALLAAHQDEMRRMIEMVTFPGGSFVMGDELTKFKTDKPVHTVHLSSFEIGKYEVTQRVYRQVMLSNPSYLVGDELPVCRVSFVDAIAFCNQLSIIGGLTPVYRIEGDKVHWDREGDGYRLPTESEWEYAARGSGARPYPWDSGEEPGKQLCWSGPGGPLTVQGFRGPTSVGSHPDGRTPEGLLDMAGNVWEWCWDWFAPYPAEETHDPMGPDEPPVKEDRPPLRVLRGAAWSTRHPEWVHSSTRSKEIPTARDPDIGFRVARSTRSPGRSLGG